MEPSIDQPPTVDAPSFYDAHWRAVSTTADPHIQAKAELMTAMVPDGIRTIVDVGCGDGSLTHRFAERWEVTAVDHSTVALEHLRCKTVQASADALTLPDHSADLLLSSEMLEHLPDDVLSGAAREFDRVAKGWLMLSVPYMENLRRRFGRCSGCGAEFNVYEHLHSFDSERLEALFPGFERVTTEICGPAEERTFSWLEIVRQRWARHWWMGPSIKTRCPDCGLEDPKAPRRWPWHQLLERCINIATGLGNLLLNRKPQPYWLVLLLRRRVADDG